MMTSSRIEVKTAECPAGSGMRRGAVEVMARPRLSLRQRVSRAEELLEAAALERLRADVCGGDRTPPRDDR
jgi:hypothetical protein